MNKQELLNKANELLELGDKSIKLANELKDLASKQDEGIIYVPNEIKLNNGCESIGIINGTQQLFYSEDMWKVGRYNGTTDKFKLVKCNYEDLKPGDVFYGSDDDLKQINELINYRIKLSDGSYQYWIDKDCVNYSIQWKYYYKVVLAE